LIYTLLLNMDVQDESLNYYLVYDCGSRKGKHIIRRELEFSSCTTDRNLTFLLISHLHQDHISGLDFMCEYFNLRGTIVVLPYFPPELRAISLVLDIMRFKEEGKPYPADGILIHVDPLDYIVSNLDSGNSIKIVLIYDSDLPPTDKDFYSHRPTIEPNVKTPRDKPTDRPEDLWKVIYDTFRADTERLLRYLRERYPLEAGVLERLFRENILIMVRGYLSISILGLYEFLMIYPPIDRDVVESIKQEIMSELRISKLDVDTLREIVTTSSKQKELRRIVEKHIRDLNDYSLIFYHGVDKHIHEYRCIYKITPSKTLYNPYCHCGAELLTGDVSLRSRRTKNRLNQLGDERLSKISVLQVPHHGSNRDWSPYVFKKSECIHKIGVIFRGKSAVSQNVLLSLRYDCNAIPFICDSSVSEGRLIISKVYHILNTF